MRPNKARSRSANVGKAWLTVTDADGQSARFLMRSWADAQEAAEALHANADHRAGQVISSLIEEANH